MDFANDITPLNRQAYPRAYWNVHLFQLFNAIAFQIVMGAPVIVYAKSLGAGSTIIGILAAFTPLMSVLQMPAASFIPRFGYRRFVLMGWGARTVFIFVVALTPLAFFWDDTTKLVVICASLFVFNLIRGIASAAFLPWMTSLVPSAGRGRFLSLDLTCMYLGYLLALFASAWVMAGGVSDSEYTLVFVLSGIGGILSLYFVKRIPDVPTGEKTTQSAYPVPWLAMLKYRPFFWLIISNLALTSVLGSLSVFTVEFMREIPQFDISLVVCLSGLSFVAPLLLLPFLGRIIDHTGSKPIMFFAILLYCVIISAWFLVACGVIPCNLCVVACLTFLAGSAAASYGLANTRLAMATMPEMGRNHFFALFSVVTGFGLGVAPIAWGVLLDILGTVEIETGWLLFRRHSYYFLGVLVLAIVSLLLLRRVEEVEGASHLACSLKPCNSSDNEKHAKVASV